MNNPPLSVLVQQWRKKNITDRWGIMVSVKDLPGHIQWRHDFLVVDIFAEVTVDEVREVLRSCGFELEPLVPRKYLRYKVRKLNMQQMRYALAKARSEELPVFIFSQRRLI